MSRDSRVLLAKRALETTLDPQRHGGSASRSVTTSYHIHHVMYKNNSTNPRSWVNFSSPFPFIQSYSRINIFRARTERTIHRILKQVKARLGWGAIDRLSEESRKCPFTMTVQKKTYGKSFFFPLYCYGYSCSDRPGIEINPICNRIHGRREEDGGREGERGERLNKKKVCKHPGNGPTHIRPLSRPKDPTRPNQGLRDNNNKLRTSPPPPPQKPIENSELPTLPANITPTPKVMILKERKEERKDSRTKLN